MRHLQRDLVRGEVDLADARQQHHQRRERAHFEQHLHAQRRTDVPQLEQVLTPDAAEAEPVAGELSGEQDPGLQCGCDQRRPGGARHTHVQPEDEQRVERDVRDVRDDRRGHRNAGVAHSVARLTERSGKQVQRRTEDADSEIERRQCAGLGVDAERRKQVRQRTAQEHQQAAQADRGDDTRADQRRQLIPTPRAHGLRDEHLDAAYESESKAEDREAGDATEPHACKRRRPEPADEQRVCQGHDAEREHRDRDRPRQPHQLGVGFVFPVERLSFSVRHGALLSRVRKRRTGVLPARQGKKKPRDPGGCRGRRLWTACLSID